MSGYKETHYAGWEPKRRRGAARCRFVRSICSVAFFEIAQDGSVTIEYHPGQIGRLLRPGRILALQRVRDYAAFEPNDILGEFFVGGPRGGIRRSTSEPEKAEMIFLERVIAINKIEGRLIHYEEDGIRVSINEREPGFECFRVCVFGAGEDPARGIMDMLRKCGDGVEQAPFFLSVVLREELFNDIPADARRVTMLVDPRERIKVGDLCYCPATLQLLRTTGEETGMGLQKVSKMSCPIELVVGAGWRRIYNDLTARVVGAEKILLPRKHTET